MKTLALILGFAFVLVLSACGRTAEEGGSSSRNAACFYNEQSIPSGTKWKEDCNSCRCSNGFVSCTQMACAR